ncbi:MAG: TetR-like C-terminal domain-containing protein [Actinomycetota bacterium]|nr:TetR-like C-terminal domain-containing protein [Actinomycetota bacterium]
MTPGRVVEAAEQMVDEVGLQQLTLAALAARLGIRQPSLYKHIDSLDALRHRIAVRAKAELADVLGQAAIGRAGADAVAAMSHAYRGWALEHPRRYQAVQRAPVPGDVEDEAASDRVVRVVAAVMDGYGLAGDDAIDAIRALRAALHGFVSLETGGGFGLSANIDRSFDRLVAGLAAGLQEWNQGIERISG